MIPIENRYYMPNCGHNDVDINSYYLRDEVFGKFIENGRGYVVERRDTPRGWTQYLCNDKVRSAVTNVGKGFLFYANGVSVTKQYEVNGNYLPRNLNGERKLIFEIAGKDKQYDYFMESENFTCTVRPGYVVYEGDIENLHIVTTIFVPLEAPCECWAVKITNKDNAPCNIKVVAKQDIRSMGIIEADNIKGEIRAKVENPWINQQAYSIFTASKAEGVSYEAYNERFVDDDRDETIEFYREAIESEFLLEGEKSLEWNIVSAAYLEENEADESLKYIDSKLCNDELSKIIAKWDEMLSAEYCSVPDKNFEAFVNFWLKNQIYLTYRYDRATHLTGYRDGMQDSWGYLFLDPKTAKEKIMFMLGWMYADGRCPRGIHKYGDRHDLDDFCDAPIWIPITINAYIKETGDYGILDEKVGFFKSDEIATVEEHIYRSLDYMYHSRGKNGLILMRDGDWADGLTGINKYGEDATSAWVTIAAYNAQNLMAEIYRKIGNTAKADEMDRRSAEYKKIVNDVAWDGNWLVYAYFEDGEGIGSAKNPEGKIWLNPQTWGIFTGIVDDKSRIKKISDAVSRYLDTPYGALVNYPAYVFYGERCGRLQGERPGMFLNAAIYNHAASFKVFSDIKRGDNDVAFDTFMRCLPNHPDNSDTRRSSEPFSICNVYYGPDHHRYGMNLFTWFTAAPAWLIHGGFEEILGVKADFDGLKIAPNVPTDWNEYSVSKLYRGTRYNIKFIRSADKGIVVDGKTVMGNIVKSDSPVCEVEVRF